MTHAPTPHQINMRRIHDRRTEAADQISALFKEQNALSAEIATAMGYVMGTKDEPKTYVDPTGTLEIKAAYIEGQIVTRNDKLYAMTIVRGYKRLKTTGGWSGGRHYYFTAIDSLPIADAP